MLEFADRDAPLFAERIFVVVRRVLEEMLLFHVHFVVFVPVLVKEEMPKD